MCILLQYVDMPSTIHLRSKAWLHFRGFDLPEHFFDAYLAEGSSAPAGGAGIGRAELAAGIASGKDTTDQLENP